MSSLSFVGSLELGLVYGFVALGVYLSFRVLDFPDLTTDGSFPLGAAVSAAAITNGINPWLSIAMAASAGGCAGLATAALTLRFKILGLLSGILTMTALYSINIRVMGRPNVALLNEPTIFDTGAAWGLNPQWSNVIVLFVLAVLAVVVLGWFLATETGLGMRATGVNPRMAKANGVNTNAQIYAGLAISHSFIASSGALFAQLNGFADVTGGIGTIVVGLASVILGETFFRTRTPRWLLGAAVFGSIVYRIAVQLALSADVIGLKPSDLSLLTALLVAVAMVLPQVRLRLRGGLAT